MSNRVKLVLTNDEFEGLHEIVNTSRSSTEKVKVPRQALVNLLLDYGELVARIGYKSYDVPSDGGSV